MRFQVLGPLEVHGDQGDVTPSAPKVREVLALLLLHHGHIVQSRTLIDELWGEDPPQSALATLQTYIYKLRKILVRGPAGETLRTKAYGYVMTVSPEDLDHCRFERLLGEGQAVFDGGEPERASALLGQGLALWRGPALADVDTGPILSAEATRLEERRLRALEMRIEADLQLGRHQELVSELKRLTSTHPLHEVFHAKLMMALRGAGRRYEALDVYQRLRSTLVEDLGLEPSASIARLHQSILTSDEAPEPVARSTAVLVARTNGNGAAVAGAAETPAGRDAGSNGDENALARRQDRQEQTRAAFAELAPAQLPPDIEDFTGRADILDRFARHLTGDENRGSVRVASIVGMAGVGKSALAVHLAHRVRQKFPDGQFYADLGGMQDEPAPPGAVLHQFLRAAGFSDDEIATSAEGRAQQFRTWAAHRRVLLVLDDAGSSTQVTQLLPGWTGSAVIVTGRGHGLPSSATVALDALDPEDGTALLAKIVGPGRVDMERSAANRIVRLCGMLPLAIRMAGMRLTARPSWPLATYADELAAPENRLNALRIGDLDLRTAFDATYRRVGDRERAIAQLIALLPAGAFTAVRAADLLGCDLASAEAVLGRLAENHLVRVARRDAAGLLHYAFPELGRLYARERLEQQITGRSTGRAGPLDAMRVGHISRDRVTVGASHSGPDRHARTGMPAVPVRAVPPGGMTALRAAPETR